tara:strand:+ start:1326 stop:1838 length:513 start_codon:yes stop_codon:yes gene_type:complete
MKKYREAFIETLTRYRDKNDDQIRKINAFDDSAQNNLIEEAIRERINDFIQYTTDKSDGRNNRVTMTVESFISNHAKRNERLDSYLKQIDFNDGRSGGAISKLKKNGALCRKVALELVDQRNEEAKAHLYEQFRFVVFRMLTGIGIAAIVLGTAYLAHILEIPLPGLRLV